MSDSKARHLEPLHPANWAPARGYANGVRVRGGGDLVFVAGQIAWDPECNMVGVGDFARQFAVALANFLAVVAEADGTSADVASMTIFVTDKRAYLSALKEIGAAWREHMGRHFPAMALVEVSALVEDEAMVEIQGMAVVSPEE